ncbi:ribonuclease D [Candidatus Finniella inopinata]|nr:hypothetical protein [Candidatus Finniella inopinata]
MSWTLIDAADSLQKFCQEVLEEKPSFIAIDCEFVRQTTYWPHLGLLQLATPNHAVIIDPVIHNLSLGPLEAILQEPSITKVFHSGHQDIEILYNLLGDCPRPIFDTQIAAAFAGLGEGLGYEKLVNVLLDIKVSKDEQFTDWLKRPLRQEQLDYAIHDVLYLKEIYGLLKDRLDDLGRQNWPEEFFLNLSNPKTFAIAPEKAWQRLRAPFSKWQQYSILWDLAAWREQYAQTHNISRSLLADNRLLLDLSIAPFMEQAELKETLKSHRQKLNTDALFENFYRCYEKAHQFLDQDDLTQQHRKQIIKAWTSQSFQNQLTTEQKQAFKNMRITVQKVADQLSIPVSCVSNRREIESFISCPDASHKLLNGWRGGLLREVLKSFLNQGEN